jgi:16S rRNA (cytosine1402-N4)-methyltransferase
MDEIYYHSPVLLDESLDALNLKNSSVVIDATCGEGGHSSQIIKISGRLICIDRNKEILEIAKERLSKYSNISFHQVVFDKISDVLSQEKLDKVDGIIADLGISMYHLKRDQKTGDNTLTSGLSYTDPGPLDMRLDRTSEVSAHTVVNKFKENEIADILYQYGEEYESRRIARAICHNRPVNSALELAEIVMRAKKPGRGKIHPASKTFQALRIYVNKELQNLESFIPIAVDNLSENGRLVIITYHSLEDRIVKYSFRNLEQMGLGKVMTKKPIIPSDEEMKINRASRSAKLRIFEKRGVVNA